MSFDIDSGDADIIFTDLDHDGDGQIRYCKITIAATTPEWDDF